MKKKRMKGGGGEWGMNRSTRRTTRLLSVANECIILFNKPNLYLEFWGWISTTAPNALNAFEPPVIPRRGVHTVLWGSGGSVEEKDRSTVIVVKCFVFQVILAGTSALGFGCRRGQKKREEMWGYLSNCEGV